MVLWLGVITALTLFLVAKTGIESNSRLPYLLGGIYLKFAVLWGLFALRGPGGI